MAASRFTYSRDELAQWSRAPCVSPRHGATEAEADISEGYGQSVTVRHGEVETIEYNRDKGLSVTVYIASSAVMRRAPISRARDRGHGARALSIARFTAADDCAGLAEPELIAHASRDLDLFHPWDLPIEQAIVMARECEAAALRLDKRIVNSEAPPCPASSRSSSPATAPAFSTAIRARATTYRAP